MEENMDEDFKQKDKKNGRPGASNSIDNGFGKGNSFESKADERHHARTIWEGFKRRAANQFFNKTEILWILQNAEHLDFSKQPDKAPKPGRMYLFDRKTTRYWRRFTVV